MIIRVTEEHIMRGIRRDSCRCPVGLAIKEKLKEFKNTGIVDVNASRIMIIYNETATDYKWIKTTRNTAKFIRAFDELGNAAVKPFRFRFRLNFNNLK